MHRITWPMLAGLSALTIGVACAQQPPTLRTRTSLVMVPVCPLDKHGKFIPNVTAADIELLIDGKPVQFSSLESVSAPARSASGIPLPENTYTNLSSSTVPGSFVILLVDLLNTSDSDRNELRKALLKFFAKRLKPDEPIAVYGLTTSLVEIQPFTTDSSRLITVANTILNRKDSRGAPPKAEIISNPSLPTFGARSTGGSDGVLEDMLSRQKRLEFNMTSTIVRCARSRHSGNLRRRWVAFRERRALCG